MGDGAVSVDLGAPPDGRAAYDAGGPCRSGPEDVTSDWSANRYTDSATLAARDTSPTEIVSQFLPPPSSPVAPSPPPSRASGILSIPVAPPFQWSTSLLTGRCDPLFAPAHAPFVTHSSSMPAPAANALDPLQSRWPPLPPPPLPPPPPPFSVAPSPSPSSSIAAPSRPCAVAAQQSIQHSICAASKKRALVRSDHASPQTSRSPSAPLFSLHAMSVAAPPYADLERAGCFPTRVLRLFPATMTLPDDLSNNVAWRQEYWNWARARQVLDALYRGSDRDPATRRIAAEYQRRQAAARVALWEIARRHVSRGRQRPSSSFSAASPSTSPPPPPP